MASVVDGTGLLLLCAVHNTRLDSTQGTNGEGDLVELIYPCPDCRSRITFVQRTPRPEPPPPAMAELKRTRRSGIAVPKPQRDAKGRLICLRCGEVIRRKKGARGRNPCYCGRCK
jgi:uncharacterized protein YbaR (Trm112 family)